MYVFVVVKLQTDFCYLEKKFGDFFFLLTKSMCFV